MSEKMAPVFLPAVNEQGTQEFTVKDATIFIGREEPRRSTSSCARCLTMLGMLIAFGIGAVILGQKFERLPTVIIVSQPVGPCKNSPTMESTTAASTTSATTNPTNWIPNGTVLYSLMNPAAAISSYMQIATLYTAQDYRTTLSFALWNRLGSTYLDDVSVTITGFYGREYIINGDFENNTVVGWTGADIHSNYISLHNGSNCHMTHLERKDVVSQTFFTTPGTTLNISFSLQWTNSGTDIFHKVIIFP